MKNPVKNFPLLLIGFFIFSCAVQREGTAQNAGAFEPTSSTETGAIESRAENYGNKTASELLSESPRHQEWVTLTHGNRELEAFVVYPEKPGTAKSVIVIHENRGLNDWARLFTDKLAAEGFLVIAPDLISNTKGKNRTTDFENADAARNAIYSLEPEQVTLDLNAAFNYIKNDPSATGEVAVVGFCWGGSQAFRYATNNTEISSAHVFYGTAPEDIEALASISAPVYGYYGEDDNRVNATIEQTQQKMEEVDAAYEYEIYEGAGHAFMNRAHQPDASQANKEAHDAAWKRLLVLLKE